MTKERPGTTNRLSLNAIEEWEERNRQALRAAFAKAERDARGGKGIAFDPMKPGALLKQIVGVSKRRRTAA